MQTATEATVTENPEVVYRDLDDLAKAIDLGNVVVYIDKHVVTKITNKTSWNCYEIQTIEGLTLSVHYAHVPKDISGATLLPYTSTRTSSVIHGHLTVTPVLASQVKNVDATSTAFVKTNPDGFYVANLFRRSGHTDLIQEFRESKAIVMLGNNGIEKIISKGNGEFNFITPSGKCLIVSNQDFLTLQDNQVIVSYKESKTHIAQDGVLMVIPVEPEDMDERVTTDPENTFVLGDLFAASHEWCFSDTDPSVLTSIFQISFVKFQTKLKNINERLMELTGNQVILVDLDQKVVLHNGVAEIRYHKTMPDTASDFRAHVVVRSYLRRGYVSFTVIKPRPLKAKRVRAYHNKSD